MQEPLFQDLPADETQKKGAGPPNRMNDLVYRDWMKFQKSFFRFENWPALLNQTIQFFTKERWPGGDTSKTLLIGFQEHSNDLNVGSRNIVHDDMVSSDEGSVDFVFVNWCDLTPANLNERMGDIDQTFDSIARVLKPGRYAGVVVDWPVGESVFPVPWAVALLGRRTLRLRDERIGLLEQERRCRYCLFFERTSEPADHVVWKTTDTKSAAIFQGPLWVMPKSPPRKADEIFHPAKFPESLVGEFIRFFTDKRGTVLDVMAGTGSALVAALREGRHGVGIELNPEYAQIAEAKIHAEHPPLLEEPVSAKVHQGDARDIKRFCPPASVQYCVTSPPYWSMLTNEGSENQKARRDKQLPTVYSDSSVDIGNIGVYSEFVSTLTAIYEEVADVLTPDGHLTVIVKNIKREHIMYPLAWDLVRFLTGHDSRYEFAGATLWCQDDVSIKPFAVGIYWVSNTLHTYCLHFRRR